MKNLWSRTLITTLAALIICAASYGREYKVHGPQGGLAMDVTLPRGFNPDTDRCPMVILMHGIFSSKDFLPMPQLARALAKKGIASVRFDFGGHWHSEGEMIGMTIAKELEDARAIWEYASSLPYVSEIALLGHSQGGAVASMFAGMLASEGKAPSALVLLAPGSVIKEACQGGHFFGNEFDPSDPPEYIKCFGTFKLGREYMITTQSLPIYETAAAYRGPVCIVHGDKDGTVPLWCSEKYVGIYKDPEFHLIEGENHRFSRKTRKMVRIVTDFLSGTLLRPQSQSLWADSQMWYQSVSGYDAGRTDVLYFVSTDVLSAKDAAGNVSWHSTLSQEDKAAMTGEIAWVEKNMFHDDFNFSAPYYHQFTFDSIWQLDSSRFADVYRDVAAEACQAFDYYMSNINNGRPYILAGFSQGAMLTLDVLKHMTDEQYSRMIACYTMGYRLSAEDLEHPHIKPATRADDRGVVISFNSTMTRDAIWPFVARGAAACINPVSWRTDSTPATFTLEGTSNTARIDPDLHVLLVETGNPDIYHSFYKAAPCFLDAGVSPDNLHHWDLLFYAAQIHDNALVRAR